jgi:PEP-CTERM motif
VKTNAWLKAAWCAVVLCGAAAAKAEPGCATLARPPSWAECAVDDPLSLNAAGAAFDGPVQLHFDDDALAAAPADLSVLAVKPHGAAQRAVEAASTVAAIPEPQTNLLLVAGLAAIGFMAMRRRRQ